MIRSLHSNDISLLAELWLQSSLEAHPFIAASYWQSNLAQVREMLAQNAETYVFVSHHKICGFISLIAENHIGALFVDKAFQSQGIGTKLIRYVLRCRPRASLNVYAANQKAIDFYHHMGFKIIREQIDLATGVPELLMCWAKGCKNALNHRPGES